MHRWILGAPILQDMIIVAPLVGALTFVHCACLPLQVCTASQGMRLKSFAPLCQQNSGGEGAAGIYRSLVFYQALPIAQQVRSTQSRILYTNLALFYETSARWSLELKRLASRVIGRQQHVAR